MNSTNNSLKYLRVPRYMVLKAVLPNFKGILSLTFYY